MLIRNGNEEWNTWGTFLSQISGNLFRRGNYGKLDLYKLAVWFSMFLITNVGEVSYLLNPSSRTQIH
jgi:hypothetical protein